MLDISLTFIFNFSAVDGRFPNWFGKCGHVTGGFSGKWLLFIWSVVLMMYLMMFESMFFGIMMKANMEDSIDTTKVFSNTIY